MKRVIIYLLIALFIFAFASCEKKHTLELESKYNSDGYLTKITNYYASGERSETIYDGTSQQRALSGTDYNESGNVTSTRVYEYNSDGYLTKATGYYASGVKKYEIIYDGTSKRWLSNTAYDESGNVTSKEENEYNSDGYLTKATVYYASGAKWREITYDGTSQRIWLSETYYDESGNVTEEYEYNSYGYRTTYTEYYASGAKRKKIIYDGTSQQRILSTTLYDESGNVI